MPITLVDDTHRKNARDILIVACTPHYFEADYVSSFKLPKEWGLDVRCEFTNDTSRISEADALWFHAPSIKTFPVKRANQKWILMSMESAENYPILDQPDFRRLFDIQMTYRLDSDVPCIYSNWHKYLGFTSPPLDLNIKKQSSASALYVASNPRPERDDFVEDLMRHIKIDSLGKCLNNKSFNHLDFADLSKGGDRFTELAERIAKYKFYLAFENSVCQDYVTEKVLSALSVGSVPIYDGAPNIDEFLPSKKCVINKADFSSSEELAEYLRFLDANDEEYLSYLKWKQQDLSPQFKQLVDLGSIEPKYRMALKLLHNCGSQCGCGGKLRI